MYAVEEKMKNELEIYQKALYQSNYWSLHCSMFSNGQHNWLYQCVLFRTWFAGSAHKTQVRRIFEIIESILLVGNKVYRHKNTYVVNVQIPGSLDH